MTSERLALTYAGVPYFDRTRAIERGDVQPTGVELTFRPFEHVGELFRRMAQDTEFDVAEMSLSTLILMVSRGDDRLVGLPIFLSRAFRHSQVYVNVDSGISSPEDLRGRRVGIPEYQMTAALWIRAFLQHDYGVAPSDVDWWTGGLMTPQYRERLGHSVPEDVSLRRIPEDRALEEMLEVGDLDALVTARAPVPFLGGSPKIRRLFPNYVEVEQDYHRRTGFFPIMHAVAMRRSTYEANPWIATALLDAFEEAKRVSLERLHDQDTLPVMHPWMDATLDQIHYEFQGDPFVYGFEPNHEILDAMVSYSVEQGLAQTRLRPQDLMAPESLDWRP